MHQAETTDDTIHRGQELYSLETATDIKTTTTAKRRRRKEAYLPFPSSVPVAPAMMVYSFSSTVFEPSNFIYVGKDKLEGTARDL
ncbi:hypothetical protein CGLO_10143 [Colletotrichum gloeosporioides Cg-14]|uniref:Uncharacterized protein n=1 Tax=Colletotrichum gloeosporioides (strain Cg-14) TaxID=1237896 RepID=T0K3W7_COLGC|nr:hypothetical protein CGLO_10143 [Colletotrichum gloeosporioides Cg-14]